LAAPQRNLRRGTHQGAAGLSPRSLARRNTLDEMTVARTEVPLGDRGQRSPWTTRPVMIARKFIGAGSYEDPGGDRRSKAGRGRAAAGTLAFLEPCILIFGEDPDCR